MSRLAYVIFGLLFLGLGVVGVMLPLIPTTPFVLLSSICFGKSSGRLHNWFISTRLYKNNIEGIVYKKNLTIKAKVVLLSTITVFMGLSMILMWITSAPLMPQIILGIVWVMHVAYFGFFR